MHEQKPSGQDNDMVIESFDLGEGFSWQLMADGTRRFDGPTYAVATQEELSDDQRAQIAEQDGMFPPVLIRDSKHVEAGFKAVPAEVFVRMISLAKEGKLDFLLKHPPVEG